MFSNKINYISIFVWFWMVFANQVAFVFIDFAVENTFVLDCFESEVNDYI